MHSSLSLITDVLVSSASVENIPIDVHTTRVADEHVGEVSSLACLRGPRPQRSQYSQKSLADTIRSLILQVRGTFVFTMF